MPEPRPSKSVRTAQMDHVEKEADAASDRLERALSFVREKSVLPDSAAEI